MTTNADDVVRRLKEDFADTLVGVQNCWDRVREFKAAANECATKADQTKKRVFRHMFDFCFREQLALSKLMGDKAFAVTCVTIETRFGECPKHGIEWIAWGNENLSEEDEEEGYRTILTVVADREGDCGVKFEKLSIARPPAN